MIESNEAVKLLTKKIRKDLEKFNESFSKISLRSITKTTREKWQWFIESAYVSLTYNTYIRDFDFFVEDGSLVVKTYDPVHDDLVIFKVSQDLNLDVTYNKQVGNSTRQCILINDYSSNTFYCFMEGSESLAYFCESTKKWELCDTESNVIDWLNYYLSHGKFRIIHTFYYPKIDYVKFLFNKKSYSRVIIPSVAIERRNHRIYFPTTNGK